MPVKCSPGSGVRLTSKEASNNASMGFVGFEGHNHVGSICLGHEVPLEHPAPGPNCRPEAQGPAAADFSASRLMADLEKDEHEADRYDRATEDAVRLVNMVQ